MAPKVCLTIAAKELVLGLLLFGSAGTLTWLAGWGFLIELFVASILVTRMLARRDPALLAERMKSPLQKGQPVWDRIFISSFMLLFSSWFVLMGLDAVRFHWSTVPAWLQVIGAVGVAVSMWIVSRVFRENTFAAPVVKIQKERGHKVISTGPYALVRHPMYVGALLFFPSTALMLGSWWGLAGAIPLVALLVVRTAKEDRELQRGLEGYAEYAGRVRFRLVPRVW